MKHELRPLFLYFGTVAQIELTYKPQFIACEETGIIKPQWSSTLTEDYSPPIEAEFFELAVLPFLVAVVSESVKVMALKPLAVALLLANGSTPGNLGPEPERELAENGCTLVFVKMKARHKEPSPLQLESPSAMARPGTPSRNNCPA